MTKKKSRLIAILITVIAVCFVAYALNNPQASFPWSNAVIYTLYGIYALLTVLFFAAPFKK